ncbi:MAG: hypothetical protein HMLKMBBP_01423 [Planctomycetes bacterium]|nr:hypothetical protein [Planctomycetota bacterium]
MTAAAQEEDLRAEARRCMEASAPRDPRFHLLRAASGWSLLAADGSQLFDADPALVARLRAATTGEEIGAVLAAAGLAGPPRIDDTPLDPPPVHALSLAVAQKCNLGCGYCYAQQGDFGGPAKSMPVETALRSVEMLVGRAEPGARTTLAFLGGEPLVARDVLRAATLHAKELGERRGVNVSFSITTNGTLLTADDGDFFEEHGFAVTVSLDGPRAVHDLLRPDRRGRGSYDRILANVRPLLARQRKMQVSARVTVTPRNLGLRETLREFVAEGFYSVGFSPMLASSGGNGEMQAADLETMLGEMIGCGREYERRTARGERFPFANLVNALREIEKGTHRPYPCGAGAGYLGVSADGELSACHRFVGDSGGAMGSVAGGVDRGRQIAWLTDRHVHRQEPCASCWARYMCGGGCHHEAIRRGRPACDYIRGWLHHCLEVYLRLPRRRFEEAAPAAERIGTG